MGARRRPLFLIPVLGLHVLLVLLLTVQKVRQEQAEQIVTVALSTTENPTETQAPPAIPLRLARPTDIALPIPEITSTPEPAAEQPAALSPSASPPISGDPGEGLAVISAADYLRKPLMPYPKESARRREQGTVLLIVLIGEDGLAKEVLMYRSSGYPSLDEAARQAVYTAVFRPFSVNGKPRETRVVAPFIFTITERPAG